jgi:beta-mannosidase
VDTNPGSNQGVLAASTSAALQGTSEADFRRVIYLSQLAQTLCIKSYLEELRRGNHTMGSLIWQLNDVWQASSWGSLDYGGRWRALHHHLQALFAPTVVSVWVDNSTEALHVYVSHHGSSPTSASQVEVNVTSIATGLVTSSRVTNAVGPADGSTVIRPLLRLPLAGIHQSSQLVTTRLMQTRSSSVDAQPEVPVVVVHPLLPPAEMDWAIVATADVTLDASALAAADWQTVVTITNKAATPLFYVLLTTTFAGRFDSNLLYVPPRSSQDVRFAFAEAMHEERAPTKQEFEASLHVDWLNRGVS